MKKLLIASNILLLTIICFMACNPSTQNNSKTAIVQPLDPCMRQFCKVYPASYLNNSRIKGDLIKSMSDSFAADPGKGYISSSAGVFFPGGINPNIMKAGANGAVRDALSVVFDIEKLKTLIWLMDSAFCKASCDTTKELGIRFYYIKYPSTIGTSNSPEDLGGIKAENRNKHSLVMVPVYRKRNMPGAEWYDYDLWSLEPGCFHKIFLPNTSEFQFWGIGPDPGDNHGGIGPPPEPGTFPTNAQ